MRERIPLLPGIFGNIEILPDEPECRKLGGMFYKVRCLSCGRTRWASATKIRGGAASCPCSVPGQIKRRRKEGPPSDERAFVERWAKRESER